MSALRIGRLYPHEIFLVLHFCQRLSQPQGHSAAGRIISMKNSNDTIGNRTRDLPACSAVLQPTAPPRAPSTYSSSSNLRLAPLLKGIFEKKCVSKCISLPVLFTALLVTPSVLRGNNFLEAFKYLNLRRALIFSSEKCDRRCTLNSK